MIVLVVEVGAELAMARTRPELDRVPDRLEVPLQGFRHKRERKGCGKHEMDFHEK